LKFKKIYKTSAALKINQDIVFEWFPSNFDLDFVPLRCLSKNKTSRTLTLNEKESEYFNWKNAPSTTKNRFY